MLNFCCFWASVLLFISDFTSWEKIRYHCIIMIANINQGHIKQVEHLLVVFASSTMLFSAANQLENYSLVTFQCLIYSVIPHPCSFLFLSIFWNTWRTPAENFNKAKRLLCIWGEKQVTTTTSKMHGLSTFLSNFCINPTAVLQNGSTCGKISFIYQKTFTGSQPILILVPSHPYLKTVHHYFRFDSVLF